MADKKVLGHIDCPYCGFVGGMRITEDKNGQPFGYCEADCSGQLRVGGDALRVRKFRAKYPHIDRAMLAAINQDAKLAPADDKPPKVAASAPKRSPLGDALAAMGFPS